MKNKPLTYHDVDTDKIFFIPIPALTIDNSYRNCPFDDYYIYLCDDVDCDACLRNYKNKDYLTKFNNINN